MVSGVLFYLTELKYVIFDMFAQKAEYDDRNIKLLDGINFLVYLLTVKKKNLPTKKYLRGTGGYSVNALFLLA